MILTLKDVNAFYGDSHALFNASLEVEQGSCVCILGRNGVGKSTTMKSIAGQMNSRNKCSLQGSIRFLDRELSDIAPHRVAHVGIGYVPQGRHIFPNLTVRENLLIAQRKPKDGKSITGLSPRMNTSA